MTEHSRLNILRSKFPTITEAAYLYPIFVNRKLLKTKYNLEFRIFTELNVNVYDCDYLMITSKYSKYNNLWSEKKEIYSFLENISSKVNCVIWADLTDGSGTTQFGVLPYVDLYFKGCLLKNKMNYKNRYYGSRIYADYYHNKYGINDVDSGEDHLNVIPNENDFNKIKLSWNYSLFNHTYIGHYYMKLRRFIEYLPYMYVNNFTTPFRKRDIILNSNFNVIYSRKTIEFQRTMISKLLQDKYPVINTNKYEYFNNLKKSKVVLSPFGWGELTLRDYETIIAGAALLKPDCSHLITWPNIFQSNAYYLFKWDFSDLVDLIDSFEYRMDEIANLANNAQTLMKDYLLKEWGNIKFSERFISLITQKNN